MLWHDSVCEDCKDSKQRNLKQCQTWIWLLDSFTLVVLCRSRDNIYVVSCKMSDPETRKWTHLLNPRRRPSHPPSHWSLGTGTDHPLVSHTMHCVLRNYVHTESSLHATTLSIPRFSSHVIHSTPNDDFQTNATNIRLQDKTLFFHRADRIPLS